MIQRYINFLFGISVNWIGKLGIVLVTSSFVTFVVLEIPRLMGILTNAYIGLITYLLLPMLFVVGLALIPIAWMQYRRQTGQTTQELLGTRFAPDNVTHRLLGSHLARIVGLLTVLNILFLVGVSVRTIHFMDGAVFCGTACHAVMNPEWVTYQQSPHARVRCVSCHVGEGVEALVNAKLNGAWQVVSASLNLYERPIPTPVHQLRPARETCEKCHWPKKFYGSRLKTVVRYRPDEASTPAYTTLSLKVDMGPRVGVSGIHWHVAEDREVRYASIGDKREEMIWVEVKRPDGRYERYENSRLSRAAPNAEHVRTMDCVDCHNRATHIYERPEHAVDERIRTGAMDRSLPYLKREGVRAITADYPSREAAMSGIETHIEAFYQRSYPAVASSRMQEIQQAVSALQDIYNRNIHHGMKITWGSYPNHLYHDGNGGCFRCHNASMVNKAGASIGNDCTQCHSILAYNSSQPFQYLLPAEEKDPEADMQNHLREEFLNSLR